MRLLIFIIAFCFSLTQACQSLHKAGGRVDLINQTPTIETGDQQEVLQMLNNLNSPKQPPPDLSKASKLWAEGKVEEAIDQLNEIISDYPNSPEPRLMLGAAHLELGRLEEAQNMLVFVNERWPANPNSHLLLGYWSLQKDDKSQAKSHFEEVFALTDEATPRISAYLGLGAWYESQGMQTEADRQYAEAVALEAELEEALRYIQQERLIPASYHPDEDESGKLVPDRNRRARIEAILKKRHNTSNIEKP